MRVPTHYLAVAAVVLLLAPVGERRGQGQSNKSERPQSTDQVKELQHERIAALKDAAEMEASLSQHGKASPESVLEARILVCEAESEAAEQESARVAALQELVGVLKEYEELATARKMAAEGTEVEILRIKARRLDAEIRLLQAQGEAPNRESAPEKVVVARLQPRDVVVDQQFVCSIHAQRHIDIHSLQRGYLQEVDVKEGQSVKQGDVLFKIAPQLYAARLDAELAEVEIESLNWKNTEKLYENKVVSEDEVALVKAKLASAQAKAKLAEAELKLTIILAPFDGLIDRLQQQQGSLVTEGDSLTTLSDNSLMWVYFNVPQSVYLEYMSDPANHQEVQAELRLADGATYPHTGRISAVEAQFNEATGSIPFRADFPNPDGLLRHGMTGTIVLHRALKGAVVIPQRATFEVLGKRYVYVAGRDGVAQQREIVIQHELPDEFVVQQGLAENDRIVVQGVRQIRDGEKLDFVLDQSQERESK